MGELVALDVSSIKRDRILVLDCYFMVVVFHGTNIVRWRKLGYHTLSKNRDLGHILKISNAYAKVSTENRFPNPLLIYCDQGDSKSRHLLVNLNPSTANESSSAYISDE